MRRCLQLAALGAGTVAPNPMVGAVLVYRDTIIGEGYHRIYGQAHAEVNCIRDMEERYALGEWDSLGFSGAGELIRQSTLYVSLEPCAHYGKTPPCADLIIAKGIPRVVAGIRDPFKEVDGKGIEKLKRAGVEVVVPVLEDACRELNRRFFTFHREHRPYIILKWAQSADGYIGRPEERVAVSNTWSNLLVHRWRSEEAAILVGTGTALTDNPSLTNRHWTGKHPLRLVLDPHTRLPGHLRVFDGETPTLVFHRDPRRGGEESAGLEYIQLESATVQPNLLPPMLAALYHRKVQSVLVEGGAQLLQSFIDQGLWDEIRIITSGSVYLSGGVSAPSMPEARLLRSFAFEGDHVSIYSSFAR
jgi:diaminohydroxyphosphoribosylaminopyrimidine deaminase / 5-amino-6-(5-phosphoribosylamino)uracil reductase